VIVAILDWATCEFDRRLAIPDWRCETAEPGDAR